MSLLLKPDTSRKTGEILNITPESAGWDTISMAVVRLSPGEKYDFSLKGEECVVVVLGGKIAVSSTAGEWPGLGGRKDVFSGMPWTLYLPLDTRATVTAETAGAEFAVCRCRAGRVFPPKLLRPEEVPVELRGGGNATRQINNMVLPGFPADRILVVEVYTPGGNWSSYPPHKHDAHNPPGEVDLDEIYFYKINKPEGYAFQRLYTAGGGRDETYLVRDNEAILVKDGYHPVVAAHGYDCYYLNVLGGSARSMAASDDPQYAWIRQTWRDKDPRLPLVKC
jgi:5-deoxy-glucuronate isomerase